VLQGLNEVLDVVSLQVLDMEKAKLPVGVHLESASLVSLSLQTVTPSK